MYAVVGGILSFGTAGCSGNNVGTTDSFSTLEAQFSDPSSEYRTAPFMVWNGKVTEIEIDRMLKDFKDAGCGGAFIHPRPGMITEYLSDEWYSLYHYAVNKGKEMGLDIWIYDENSYPSGFAGGHVPEDMPESYNQGQGLELTKTDLLPDKTDEYFIILKKEGDKWADITNALSQHKKAKGEYLYMVKYSVFNTASPMITKYKVVQLADRKMILESHQNLAGLGPDFSTDEVVMETYEPVSKTDDFIPYRGENPDNYIIDTCNPGSYK